MHCSYSCQVVTPVESPILICVLSTGCISLYWVYNHDVYYCVPTEPRTTIITCTLTIIETHLSLSEWILSMTIDNMHLIQSGSSQDLTWPTCPPHNLIVRCKNIFWELFITNRNKIGFLRKAIWAFIFSEQDCVRDFTIKWLKSCYCRALEIFYTFMTAFISLNIRTNMFSSVVNIFRPCNKSK